MEESDKREILEAIATLGAGMEERMDGMSARMDGMEERISSLTQEVRAGFEKLDARLVSVEDEVKAMSTTLDSLIEGTAIGTENIMLTRPEYDSLMEGAHLPNRFAH